MQKDFSEGSEAGAGWNPAPLGDCPRCGAKGAPLGWLSGQCEACTERRDFAQDNGRKEPERCAWVPEDYADTVAERLVGCRATVERALGWKPSRKKSVAILHGLSGKGKTRTAVLMAMGLEGKGRDVRAWWPGELGASVQAAWMTGGDGMARMLRENAEAGVLLLDDLDKTKVTERTGEFLFAVIDARVREGRATIITTNLTGEKLREQFASEVGGPLLRRLKDYGEGFGL